MKSITSDWMLLPPGRTAILRRPADTMPDGARLATSAELRDANQGYLFPWGNLPSSDRASRLWKEHSVGIGGLIHDRWFVTTDGRFGGAPNVPEQLPGSLRRCLLLDGGQCESILAENEGFAVVRDTSVEDADMYRRVQMQAAEHVSADGGAIIVSPIDEDGTVHTGFVGRCQICPNPELVSFRQLQKAVPDYKFVLWPEWVKWSLAA